MKSMTPPSRFALALTATTLTLLSQSQAALVSWDAGGGTGAGQQWNNALNWSDDTAPAAGNTYEVTSGTIRTIDAATSAFAGDSLTVNNGASLYYFRTNGGGNINIAVTTPNLTVDNANMLFGSSLGSVTFNQNSSVALANTVTMNFNASGSNSVTTNINGGLTGSGTLNITRTATGTGRTLNFVSSFSGYSGNLAVTGVSGDIMVLTLGTGNVGGWGTGDINLNNFAQLNMNVAVNSLTSLITMASNAQLNIGTGNSFVEGLNFNLLDTAVGTYTSSDLNTLYSTTAFSGAGTITIVPEPSIALLGGLGVLGLLRRRRN